MHPNAFLKAFWRMELRPQVFVAMPFAPDFDDRFAKVIAPAVRRVTISKHPLEPYRVDNSKKGDSILTEIVEGIAHSRLVLADVSVVGYDSKSGRAYRNANVMYEVGVALSCRQSAEVLLIRDDHEDLLFDISTIPQMQLDFADVDTARTRIADALFERLTETQLMEDARVRMVVDQLGPIEVRMLKADRDCSRGMVWTRGWNSFESGALGRLLDKQVIEVAGESDLSGEAAYRYTDLGIAVKGRVCSTLLKIPFSALKPEAEDESQGA